MSAGATGIAMNSWTGADYAHVGTIGAVASFVGVVRNHDSLGSVDRSVFFAPVAAGAGYRHEFKDRRACIASSRGTAWASGDR